MIISNVAGVHQRLQPDDMLLTTCPKCQHTFPLTSPCCMEPSGLVVSATLHLPPSVTTPASCTMTVSARRCQVGMSGGGIVQDPRDLQSVILQKGVTSSCGGKLTVNSIPPEPSPSSPIAFVIPPAAPSFSNSNPLQDSDLERLSATVGALQNSGWFYEGLSWQESAAMLMPTAPGTFLVRNSSDPRFLFSLSVQTDRGPTSVRLHYHNGHFRLDAAPKLVSVMPMFHCVVKLVEHYVAVTNSKDKPRGKEQVWIDCSGQTYSSILLTKPLYQKGRFPGLKHLARLAVNRLADHVPTRELPESLHKYLAEYPYTL